MQMKKLTSFLFIFAITVVYAQIARAEDDPMEAQRCIWRCGDSTSMKQPAYDACIKNQCDAAPAPTKKSRKKKS